jgi:hypothetical protein
MSHKIIHENKKQVTQLIKLLNEWDFLNVMGEYEKTYDEYYDLVDPILQKLKKGINKKDLEHFLTDYIKDTYGVTPSRVGIFTKKVVSWWESVNS